MTQRILLPTLAQPPAPPTLCNRGAPNCNSGEICAGRSNSLFGICSPPCSYSNQSCSLGTSCDFGWTNSCQQTCLFDYECPTRWCYRLSGPNNPGQCQTPQCTTSNDCPSNTQCVNFLCTDSLTDSPCQTDQQCSQSNKGFRVLCDTDFDRCTTFQCNSSSHPCPTGQTCIDSICHRDCLLTSDCPQGMGCSVDGTCRRLCVDNSDCYDGLLCNTSSQTCRNCMSLLDDGQCLTRYGILNGISPVCSADGTCGYNCNNDGDCPTFRKICQNNQCLPCGPETCPSDNGMYCTTDGRCEVVDIPHPLPAGQVVTSMCSPSNPTGQSTTCTIQDPDCIIDPFLNNPSFCGQWCHPWNTPCPVGSLCIPPAHLPFYEGSCEPICTTHNDCPTQRCEGRTISYYYGALTTGYYVDFGVSGTDSLGEFSFNYHCVPNHCISDSDCTSFPSGNPSSVCRLGVCTIECNLDDDCDDKEVCVDKGGVNVCVPQCRSFHNPCLATEWCDTVTHHCRPNSELGNLVTSCTTSDDCPLFGAGICFHNTCVHCDQTSSPNECDSYGKCITPPFPIIEPVNICNADCSQCVSQSFGNKIPLLVIPLKVFTVPSMVVVSNQHLLYLTILLGFVQVVVVNWNVRLCIIVKI